MKPTSTKSSYPAKSVAWSYPTSVNAKRFGFPRGCYSVSITDWSPSGASLLTTATAGFATEEEALAHAATMPQPWAWWSKKVA